MDLSISSLLPYLIGAAAVILLHRFGVKIPFLMEDTGTKKVQKRVDAERVSIPVSPRIEVEPRSLVPLAEQHPASPGEMLESIMLQLAEQREAREHQQAQEASQLAKIEAMLKQHLPSTPSSPS